MPRITGQLRSIEHNGERAEAFSPAPLPPADPPLRMEGQIAQLHEQACASLDRLRIAMALVPDPDWYLYGFVRKEAVITSRIEGTQATLADVLTYEATNNADNPDDVEEVCNYVRALTVARRSTEQGPVAIKTLCEAHRALMTGARGADKQPGMIRTTQNWVGGSKPGNAIFVPPPPEDVPGALADLQAWIAHDDSLPPLVRIGLAHAQFETIHPFHDGNGRIGRLLISLLLEQWGLLRPPLLYISLAFRREQLRYYSALTRIRTSGDWEGWIEFFLRCVIESADDAVVAAQRLAGTVSADHRRLLAHPDATVSALRLFDALSQHPIVTGPLVEQLLDVATPTANKAIAALIAAGILEEMTGRRRGREYGYSAYLRILTGDEEA